MPKKETQNPDLDQVPTQDVATEKSLTVEDIQKMSPDELLQHYVNAQEAIKAATQRNMETAEERRRLQEEREYWQEQRRQKDAELQRAYEMLEQYNQQIAQRLKSTSEPRYDEMDPEELYRAQLAEIQKLHQEIESLKEQQQKSREELRNEISVTRRAVEYDKFLDKNIFPKYPDVTKQALDDWFTEHPDLPVNPKTVTSAAAEIQKSIDDRVEARAQELLKEKERLAKEADLTGDSPLATLPPGKEFHELSPAEQAEILKEDYKRMANM